jgi:uncharacterized membrane protein YgdD (TMEM256/DUF423 family)
VILFIGALLGFISVAFGAFAEHGLKDAISEEHFRFLMTAVRYNQIHSVIIVAIGLSTQSGGSWCNIPQLNWAGSVFIIGTILFSFSIYLSVSLQVPFLLNLTPLGGITIMLGWLMLAFLALMALKNNRQ